MPVLGGIGLWQVGTCMTDAIPELFEFNKGCMQPGRNDGLMVRAACRVPKDEYGIKRN